MRPCRLVLLLLAVSFVTAAACELAHAHGGGLDRLGCHNDRNRGEYHCHRNELAGRTFASKAEAEKALAGGVPSGSNTPPIRGRLRPGPIRRLDRRRRRLPKQPARSPDRRERRPCDARRRGCKVIAGRWEDPYTGRVSTDPRDLDIDHFIPLAEMHRRLGIVQSVEEGQRPRTLAPAQSGVSLRVSEDVGRTEESLGPLDGPGAE